MSTDPAPTAAERARQDARYRVVSHTAGDVVWAMAPTGQIVYVSPTIEAMRGYTPAEAMTQPLEAIHPPESAARSTAYWIHMVTEIAAGRRPAPFRGELEYRCKDGTTFWTDVLAIPVLDDQGALVELVGVTRDLTARRGVETAQRMEAMTRMAAGVAHEVNNAIAIIRAAAEQLPLEPPGSAEAQAHQSAILTSVERVGGLTAHLLAFSQRRHHAPEPARLGDLLDGVRGVLARVAGPDVDLEIACEAPAADAILHVDRSQVDQALVQLVTNARDAVGGRGAVSLRCTRLQLAAPRATRTGILPPGDYAQLTVEDAGAGITADDLERIFDPFFTTRAAEHRAGLGLPMVFGILQQHQGGLLVDSRPGEGARFTLLWPIHGWASASAAPRRASSLRMPQLVRGEATRATVLVVDDEPLLVRLVGRALERRGCRVVTATSGAEALEVATREVGALEAVITDVRMPGMAGTEVVDALIARGVDVPVLFVSGQIDAPIPRHWPATVPRRFLAKPFSVEQLLHEIARLGVPLAGG